MAHYNDMREFLEELKKRGDLMVINKKVSPVHEICAFTRKSSDMGGPALLFTNVEGYDMPVLSGLYGIWHWVWATIQRALLRNTWLTRTSLSRR